MKSSKAIIQERRQKLITHLRLNKNADITSLAQAFSVTSVTIRRDLDYLEEKGYVKRYFGGVTCLLPPDVDEAPPADAADSTSTARREIARRAASLIQDGETVFMNSSSTALLILEYLEDKSVLIITNNGRALYSKKNPRTELILTGGEVYGQKKSLVGEFALNTLSRITATKCILGVSGISIEGGITSKVIQETAINQQMLQRCSGDKIVVAEGGKIGIRHNFFSGEITDITHLITDRSADRDKLKRLDEYGITVLIADEIEEA